MGSPKRELLRRQIDAAGPRRALPPAFSVFDYGHPNPVSEHEM